MEKVGSLDRGAMISVLSEGRDLANQLKRNLQPSSSSSSSHDSLLENILSSYENAIKLLDHCSSRNITHPAHVSNVPNSNEGNSVISEGSEITSKDQNHKKSKKRKAVLKCSEQVRVRSETGFEGQLDDGFNWRKYGQKDILGANHPRAYYRCTHRNTQGCLATKHVQRADEDPSVFEVIYRGKHSCVQEGGGLIKEITNHKESNTPHDDLIVSPKKEDAENNAESAEARFPSFSFAENLGFFPEAAAGDFAGGMNYSPPFISPATSESYFSMSQQCLQVSDFGSDLNEIVSNPSPFPSFSYGDLDYMIDQIDFDSQFLNAVDYF